MTFKIQISVETPEELIQSLSKVGRDLDAGKFPAVVNELTYLSWEHMLSIFTPEGQAIMEDFRRSEEQGPDATGCDFIGLLSESTDTHATLEEINEAITQGWSGSDKDECIDTENTAGKESLQNEAASLSSIKVSGLKVFDAADYIKDADDVMLYLRLTLSENDPISLADALNVILRSDGINKLIGNTESALNLRHEPTLREMIAKCDLSADSHPNSVNFEKAQTQRKENI